MDDETKRAFKYLFEARDAFMRAGRLTSANDVARLKIELNQRIRPGKPIMMWEAKE